MIGGRQREKKRWRGSRLKFKNKREDAKLSGKKL